MFKFDVKYTFDNYMEYYKFAMVKSKIYKDLIFMILFFAVAVYWWVDTTDSTASNFIPIFAIVMGCIFPLMNFVTIPLLKKQLNAKKDDINRTHLFITFNDEEVIYNNMSIYPEDEKKEEETVINEGDEITEKAHEDAPLEEEKAEEITAVEETASEGKKENDRIFNFKYNNFQLVRELTNLFVFYLDRQTIIILPKATIVEDGSIDEFKEFILKKVNPKRVKFLKTK